MNEISEYFKSLRFNPKHHLGLGDVRLTLDQQEEVCSLAEARLAAAEQLMNDRIAHQQANAEPVHYEGDWPGQGPCGCEKCLLARIAELEADARNFKNAYIQAVSKQDPPPDGDASWEDWLASYGIFIGHGWTVETEEGCLRDFYGKVREFPTYPEALEAAKKEAK